MNLFDNKRLSSFRRDRKYSSEVLHDKRPCCWHVFSYGLILHNAGTHWRTFPCFNGTWWVALKSISYWNRTNSYLKYLSLPGVQNMACQDLINSAQILTGGNIGEKILLRQSSKRREACFISWFSSNFKLRLEHWLLKSVINMQLSPEEYIS